LYQLVKKHKGRIMTTTTTIELQFRGYQPQKFQFPLVESMFEHVSDIDEANRILHECLMGDADRYGWVQREAMGEGFQVREVV
jgi:hypothetical protein